MKKKNLFSRMLLLLALIVGSSSAWAEDVKDVITAENLTATSTTYTDFSNVKITSDAVYAGNSAKDSNGNIQLRSKNSNSGIVSTTSGGKLKSVKITVASGSNTIDVYGSNTAYTSASNLYATGSDSNQGTKLGSVTATGTITVTGDYAYVGIRSNSGAVYISSIEITWEKESGTNPSITANDVPIAYNATSGSIAYSLANGEGNVTAEVTSGNWLTLGSITASEVPFTCSANPGTTARTATVTLSYTGATDKVVTVTQAAAPVTYTTIPALFEAATTDGTNVNVSFGNWVVSGVSGSNAYVTDNNGNGFIIYKSNHGFAVNDKLSGTVNGTPLKLYNGSAEFTNLTTSTSGLSVSHDGEITVITNKTIADLGGVNTGAVITLSNLTYDGTNLSDGTNSIKPYTTLYSGTFENGKTYNVTGVYLQYNTTKEILPRSETDIVEVVSTEPSITLDSYSIQATAAEKSGSLTVTCANIDTDAGLEIFWYTDETCATTTDEPDWIGTEITTTTLNYEIEANTGDERTAYFKIYGLDEGADDVFSELVTITQAANVPMVNYTLATAIVPGKHYIITSGTDDDIYALGAQNGTTHRDAVDVNADNGTLSIEENAGVCEFLIKVNDATGLYTLYDVTNEKYLYANSSSKNYVNIESNLDADNNGVWAIEIAEGDVANINAQGNNTHNSLRYNYNSGNPRFSCYTETSTMNDVYLFVRDDDESPVQTTITISPATSKTYTTFCRAIDLDFTNASGIEAYVVSNMSASSATITKVFTLPAGEGAILKRIDDGASESFDIPFAESANAIATNYMVGVTKATDMSEVANAYILKDGLFYECSGGTLAAGKAYLNDENGVWATSSSPSFSLIVDGETTGIDSLTPALNQGEGVYYDLSGRRIAELNSIIGVTKKGTTI